MATLKPSNRRQDEIRSSVNDQLSSGIQSALRQIERIDREKLDRMMEELMAVYGEWSTIFREISHQFLDTSDAMGAFEEKLSEWKRVEPALGPEGKWGPISLSKKGYHFATGIVKGDDPRAKKWMIVHFAHLDSSQNGMGDERSFGLKVIPDGKLSGIDECKQGMTETTLEQVQELLKRVKGYQFIFDLHHTTLGQRRIYVHPDKMNGRRLADFCAQLLVALNQDDIKQVYDLADREKVKLLESKRRRVRWP